MKIQNLRIYDYVLYEQSTKIGIQEFKLQCICILNIQKKCARRVSGITFIRYAPSTIETVMSSVDLAFKGTHAVRIELL